MQALAFVPHRDQPARLHRDGGVALHAEGLAPHVRRGSERRLRVAAADADAGMIGAGTLVDEGGCASPRTPSSAPVAIRRSRPKSAKRRPLRRKDWSRPPDAIGSPTYRTLSAASGSCRKFSNPGIAAMRDRIGFRNAEKSGNVNTPTTPGRAAAAATSMVRIRPCGHELRNKAACSIPSTWTSSTKRPRPRRRRASSCRTIGSPISGMARRPDVARMYISMRTNEYSQQNQGKSMRHCAR